MGIYNEYLDVDDCAVGCPVEGCDRRFPEN